MATQQRWSRDEIVIELANVRRKQLRRLNQVENYGPVNTYFYSKLFDARFRGRWSSVGLAGKTSEMGLMNLPEIPGIHLAVDPKRRRVRALDPLAWPENEQVLQQANDIFKKINGSQGAPAGDMFVKHPTETHIKTALWEMANWVRDGKAVLVHGHLPAMDKILDAPGQLKIRQQLLDTGERDEKGKPILSKYATETELGQMGKPPEQEVETVPAGTS
jgi:hypothetical protein